MHLQRSSLPTIMRRWSAAVCLLSVAGILHAAAPAAGRMDHSAQPPRLVEVWSTPGFANPESVALSANRRFLYVSNVNGEGDARDGNGYISRLGLDGKVLHAQWSNGLDAPKGLALHGRRLFVSDVSQLVEIDARDGRIVARHGVEGAKFLNDVAIAPKRTPIAGGVLVSDSATARIHLWRKGRMSTWLEAPLLRSINGLLPERDRLIVTTMQGRLLAVDWKTRAITTLAEGIGDGDGVVALGDGAHLVGEWPGRLFHVADGEIDVLIDSRETKRYINDFILIDAAIGDRDRRVRTLIVPGWEPGVVTAYRIER